MFFWRFQPVYLFFCVCSTNVSIPSFWNDTVKVVQDRETGRSKGFGFVSFMSTDDAEAAKKSMDGQVEAQDSSIVVEKIPKYLLMFWLLMRIPLIVSGNCKGFSGN